METLDLTSFCRTKAEAQTFVMQLTTLSKKVYQTDFHFETALAEVFGLQKRDAFLKLLRTSGTTFKTPADFKNFLESIRTQVSSLPLLSLTLAFEPNETTLKLLTDWFLLNSKRHILFDISVDPSLIAGVAIRYSGRYVEYSIKPTVQKIIQEALINPTPQTVAPKTQQVPHQSLESMSLGR